MLNVWVCDCRQQLLNAVLTSSQTFKRSTLCLSLFRVFFTQIPKNAQIGKLGGASRSNVSGVMS
jgi:hypothetical protein